MRSFWHWRCLVLAGWCVLTLVAMPNHASQPTKVEEKFESLQIGAQTYTNVTVTTKAEDYIFILHSGGMANIKVSELPDELLLRFGYIEPPKPQTNTAPNWAKEKMAAIQSPELTELQDAILANAGPAIERVRAGGPILLAAAGLTVLLPYLFSAYCCMLICRKTGNTPGLLVWIPVLNLFPLLRAASMSPAWFLGFLLPFVNLLAYVVWSFKIVRARGKQAWTALLLILPFTSPFMLMYLAFSSCPAPKEKKERASQIMTLETA